MATQEPKRKRLMSVDIDLATGQGVTWTREYDGLDKVALTETNVIMIMGEDGEPLQLYAPMYWLTVASTYSEAE